MVKLYKNENWLKKKYLNEKVNTYKIARLCNTSQPLIIYWMKKYDIPCRSVSEAKHLEQANHCNLSKEAIEWINGELLGDGCLSKKSSYSATFRYTSKHIEYIKYVLDMLKSFGIEQSGKTTKEYHKTNYTYHCASRSYVELLPIREQWYPEGKKIVPKDIELTPLVCRQWYIGDGNIYKKSINCNPHIDLYTNGFTPKGVRWLVLQLKRVGFNAKRYDYHNSIHISTYSTKEFLNYIGNCPVKCYQYKFQF